jgi:transcriptional regulator with XRE-family HTH domain
MSIGNRIKQVRGGLSREDFAAKLSIDKSSIQRYENDENIPKGDVLQKIHKQFNVNINWLLTGQGEPYKKNRVIGLEDPVGLYGKTEQIIAGGKNFNVTSFSPSGGDPGESSNHQDPFIAAVAALKEIYDSNDPVFVPAIASNIRAFNMAVFNKKFIQAQGETIQELRIECEKLKNRMESLENQVKLIKGGNPEDTKLKDQVI